MIKKIIKRDGSLEDFNEEKINIAINKAFLSVGVFPESGFCENIAKKIHNSSEKETTINDIQQMVEKELMHCNFKDSEKVATAYIIYRNEKDRQRRLIKTYTEIVEIEDGDIKNENANINGNTPAGQMMKFASTAANDFADNNLIEKRFVDSQKRGEIHIHDKDYYGTRTQTCCHNDLGKLLKGGFNTEHGYIREPNRLKTAIDLAAIALQTSQNEQHGGQAIPAWDHFLVPYFKKSFEEHFYDALFTAFVFIHDLDASKNKEQIIKKIKEKTREYGEIALSNSILKENFLNAYEIARQRIIKESDQAHESFVANMNTMHSRGGGQVVFSSVNTGTDFSEEGRIINKSLLKAIETGLGKGETSIFPIVIWKIKEGVNWSENDYVKALADINNNELEFETPNFDLFLYSCRVASKRLFPTYLFLDATFNRHEDWKIDDPERYRKEVSTMGCRTRVFENINGEKTSWGRGNLSFSTLNLVRASVEANVIFPDNKEKRLEKFFEMIDSRSRLICEQLKSRYDFQSGAKAKQFPFLFGQDIWTGGKVLNPNDKIGDVIKTGTLGIGFLGLAECLKMLTGFHHGESEESQALGLKIIQKMKDIADEYKEKYNLNFSVLATPAEGLSGKFTKKDKKDFGIIEGVTDREFYTNSFHIPVYYNISAYEKIKKESPYHELSLGGHILYVEMDTDAQKNISAFISLIKQMKDCNAGYGAINVPSCRCMKCGYDKPFDDKCPICGEEEDISIIKRITGYLVGTTKRWNSAKKEEERARVKHSV